MGTRRRNPQSFAMGIKSLLVLAALAALSLATEAQAAVVKCKAKDGSITYTQTLCPAGTVNAELPEHLNADRPSSSAAAPSGGAGVGSSKAAMYRDSAIACSESPKSESCELLGDAITFCKPESSWNSEACLALKEGLQAARDRLNMADPQSQQRLREICAKGGNLACVFQECPADMYMNGPDQLVRACAARAGMPVSSTWVKLEGKNSGNGLTGFGGSSKYVCLKKLERTNDIGERLSYRETVTVLIFAPVGGGSHEITVSSLPDEKFATADAAATAGCAAKTAPREGAPKASPRKNPQTT